MHHLPLHFSQLLHYPAYKEHEVKALWEFLQESGRKLDVIGVMGPLDPSLSNEAVDLIGKKMHNQGSWSYQSVAFVVL